ncbi:hypothetical protein RMCBS344292_04254 [Rhizopus microsporus]|nr:hypothetical protein RMCBS344292_04254 [Rhizopus microsporus]
MKFFATQIAAALLAVSSVTSAAILPRDDTNQQGQQGDATAQYPNNTNVQSLNGTWFLTAVTSNVWDAYTSIAGKMNVNVDCLQLNLTGSSNSTLDLLGSAFLNRTSSGAGLNATAAAALLLQPPTNDLNVSAHDLAWSAYTSQVFVNKAQWDNFTSNGQSNQNASESGSMAIPGSRPMQATIYTRLIDSNAQPGSTDSTNYDTIFVWGSHASAANDGGNTNTKRADTVYGAILSRSSSVSQDTFNKTLTLLPPSVNNTSIVLLSDTCNVNH